MQPGWTRIGARAVTCLDGLVLIAVGLFVTQGYGFLPTTFWRVLYVLAGLGLVLAVTVRPISTHQMRASVAGLTGFVILPHALDLAYRSFGSGNWTSLILAAIWLLYMAHIALRLAYWPLLEEA